MATNEEAKKRLDAWVLSIGVEIWDLWQGALPVGDEVDFARCVADGHPYENHLLKFIAGALRDALVEALAEADEDADLGVVVLQAGDDLSALHEWAPRDAPRSRAFKVLDTVNKVLVDCAGVPAMNPPGLDVEVLGINRIARKVGSFKGRLHYTAIVVELRHPCARTCTLIVPAEVA